MYGSEHYGTTQYAVNNQNEEIKPSSYKNNLINNVHKIYRNDKWLNEMFRVAGIDLDNLGGNIQDLINQLNPSTATWGLAIWENEFRVPTDINKSYEDRREVIKARMRGTGTTTKEMIKRTAEAFSNGECDVIEHNENYSFTVRFIGIKGIPRNMQSFKNMLEIIKPAHLNYDFQYNCTVWSFLPHTLTWGQAKSQYTWGSIKAYE